MTLDSIEYNPSEGFLLDTTLIQEPVGEYTCIAKNAEGSGTVRAFLQKPPG